MDVRIGGTSVAAARQKAAHRCGGRDCPTESDLTPKTTTTPTTTTATAEGNRAIVETLLLLIKREIALGRMAFVSSGAQSAGAGPLPGRDQPAYRQTRLRRPSASGRTKQKKAGLLVGCEGFRACRRREKSLSGRRRPFAPELVGSRTAALTSLQKPTTNTASPRRTATEDFCRRIINEAPPLKCVAENPDDHTSEWPSPTPTIPPRRHYVQRALAGRAKEYHKCDALCH